MTERESPVENRLAWLKCPSTAGPGATGTVPSQVSKSARPFDKLRAGSGAPTLAVKASIGAVRTSEVEGVSRVGVLRLRSAAPHFAQDDRSKQRVAGCNKGASTPHVKDAIQKLAYGAWLKGDQAEFRVWAPFQREITLRLMRDGSAPQDLRMGRDGEDFVATAAATAGGRYCYVLDDGLAVPDPVSRLLPEGVQSTTEIVDPAAFGWSDDAWRGIDFRDYVI